MQQRYETELSEEARQSGYSPEEYREIVRRAQQIRAEKEGRLSRELLTESAAEVGIREEDLRAAERQIEQEKQQEAIRQRERAQRRAKMGMIAAVVAALLALFMIFSYNSLSSSYAGVQSARANVEAMLQRRADLAQQLMPLVRQGAAQDAELSQQISQAREQIQQGDLAAASDELNESLGRLRALAGSNSEVGAQIEGSENRIAEYRRRYNAAAAEYNRKARSFPTNVVRPFFGMPSEVQPFQARTDNLETPPSFAP
ncbi:MAG: LemA family protein [Armatimonadota bacterium]